MSFFAPRRDLYLLAQTGVAVAALTGTTAETTLATVTVPAGMLGPNGALDILALWTFTNSANVKTLRVRLGGLLGTAFLETTQTATAAAQTTTRIFNRGSVASQVGFVASVVSGGGNSTGAIVTSAIDTSAAVSLVITGQLANAGESITLQDYSVRALPFA